MNPQYSMYMLLFGETEMKLKLCIITNLFKLIYSLSDLFLPWEVNGFGSIDPAARTSLIIPRGIIQIKHQMNLAILAKICRKGFVDKTIVKIWRQILCVKCPKNKYVQLVNYSYVMILIFLSHSFTWFHS